MFSQRQAKREKVEEREGEIKRDGATVNRLFIRTSRTTRDSIFLEEIQPSKKEFEEFQQAVCRFNRGGCRFNETIESRFRLKNGPLEMKSSPEDAFFDLVTGRPFTTSYVRVTPRVRLVSRIQTIPSIMLVSFTHSSVPSRCLEPTRFAFSPVSIVFQPPSPFLQGLPSVVSFDRRIELAV